MAWPTRTAPADAMPSGTMKVSEARLIATLALTAIVNVVVDFGAPEQPEVVNTCSVPV